jgi:hypothetical protein
MRYEQRRGGPTDGSPSRGPDRPLEPTDTAPRTAWRAPTVTRLSLERTLFFRNSPVDFGSSGTTVG